MSSGKTAFVTGANGFVGSHTVRLLNERGYNVRAMVRASSSLARLDGLDFQKVEYDLAAPRSIDVLIHAMTGIDLVVHTAAYVDLGTVDRPLMRKVNLDGTKLLLNAAQSANVASFVHCSTVRTLGDTQGTYAQGDYVRTDPDFASCYDETKTAAEAFVLARNQPGFATYSVLPPGIFGPDDPHFGRALRTYMNGRLPVWPAQDRPLQMVHVRDLADLFLRTAEFGTPGTRYMAAAGEITMGEIFAKLGALSGRRPPIQLPEWFVRALAAVMDPIGRLTGQNLALNNERITFLYDKIVLTDASRSFEELGWAPMPPDEILTSIAAERDKQG
ncbi:NAD-dependent epimerase/dehydratase family protein [Shimia abyssi]|uniref:Nucleoside-diphosphate-sugar epimerase n=1 Tax=Shimia abyssi TaxID=1662395 RepID=A0A2P8FFP9_9RHOB|nr:NAD-dependent epimerase/dehydratase family protein [Shimia abyssi]PSL20534.1 nucleoside-diphosphate-sugar epimerase [Shimia abyssi]